MKKYKDKHLSDPDNELMKRIGSGDKVAFKQLVEKYQRMVFSMGLSYDYQTP